MPYIVALCLGLWLLACSHELSTPTSASKTSTTAGGEHYACESSDPDLVRRVDVGGRRLFIACEGTGRPTVVMESGFADPGIAWGRSLIESIARISRVCVYDRAGLGYSDSRPDQPTDGGKISADLHLLLTGAGVEPPYVLVGHSIGGMYVRVYDHDHPGEVARIVLIDSSHPDQFINAQKRLRPDDWARIQHSLETAWMDPTKEPSDWLRTSLLVRQTENIGDRPLWVLSHDPAANAGCQGSDCMSPEGQATWEAMWQELQTDLAGLSSRSSHSVVAGSGHYIHIGKPEPVIEAVAQVVEATR